MNLKPLDLASFGLPLIVMAPDSASVIKKDYPIMRDITVRKGDNYYLQIFESKATLKDPADVKKSLLKSVQQNKYFKDLVMEEPDGFIFCKQPDSTLVNYDFRYIKIIGEEEIIFQAGMIGTFTLEDVQQMYGAVSVK